MVTLNNEVELRSKASLNVMLYTKDSGVFDEKAEQAIPRFDPAGKDEMEGKAETKRFTLLCRSFNFVDSNIFLF